jgi:hypothetical protein
MCFLADTLQDHCNSLTASDLPPLKWSSLRYDFDQEDRTNGKEAAYS